jgi:hypothetical protein
LKTAELTPEAQTFLKGGSPKPLAEAPSIQAVPTQPAVALVSEEREEGVLPEPPRRARARGTIQEDEAPVPTPNLVFTSLRLPAEIPHALMRASFDRKLKREKPWTQQDIAAEALSLWLKKHAYL